MDLEDELRDVLSSQSRELPANLVSLAAVHAGADRRRRRRAALVATAAGVAVLATAAALVGLPGVGGLLGGGGGSRDTAGQGPDTATSASGGNPTSPATTGSASTSSTVRPVDLPAWGAARVTSITATSTRTLVVLGSLGDTGACTPPDCVRLAESHDGGATFDPIAVPADARAEGANSPTAAMVADVRFGSGVDGWLFGGGLWATHDGGLTWTKVALPGTVRRLESAAGRAYALVDGTGDTQTLWSAAVGTDTWSAQPNVTVTQPGDLAVQGSRVVVLGAGSSPVWTNVSGAFVATANPCTGALETRISGSGSLWATCVTGTAASLATSTDDGRTWIPVPISPAQGSLPNSIAVGARTTGEAVIGLGSELQRLGADGGTTPLTGVPVDKGAISYVGFTNRQVGYAISGSRLLRTDDGGTSWAALTIG